MSSRRQTRKKKKSPIPVIISILAVIWILFITAFFFKKYSPTDRKMETASYFGLESDDEAAIVVDDQILEAKGKVINGAVYVDYQTVWDVLNSGFYWEEPSQTLYLTLPEETRTWTPDDGTGAVVLEEGLPYLSAACISENSAADVSEYDRRIVIRTSWDGLETAEVVENTPVRYRGGPKSDVLTTLKSGSTVVVTEHLDNWTGVATEDGFIGYIKTGAVEFNEERGLPHEEKESFQFTHKQFPEKIVMAWQYVDSAEGNDMLSGLIQDAEGLNVISPTWFDITNKDGKVISFANKKYVKRAHNAGLQVWAHFGDIKGKDVDVGALFETQEMRAHIIDQVIKEAKKTGFDGINLDFETIREDTAPQYLQFIRELSQAAHERDLYLSVDDMVPLYTGYYKRAEQANWADYIIVMSYDEHTSASDEAGSVASLPFVRDGIEGTLAEVPAEQVVNGIPFYTRGWTVPFGTDVPQSEALSMEQAGSFVQEHEITLSFDESLGQNFGTSSDSEARYSIWMEDEQSLTAKMNLVREYQLAGVAAWRIGFETASVWSIIQNGL
ncbi:MAG: SH3 domain-containing protein [Eubacterium sp.]|nr:SH3 domain-containing protein [Eubacterium sp.]